MGGNSNYSLALTSGANCSRFACTHWSNASHATPGRTGEDPWLWEDASGAWHALFHDMAPDLPAGRHAFARSREGPWTLTGELAYTGTAVNEDGTSTTFAKRERPHLLLDPVTRVPLALFTGVMPLPESVDDRCYTHAQRVSS